jgi:hypothetical protein
VDGHRQHGRRPHTVHRNGATKRPSTRDRRRRRWRRDQQRRAVQPFDRHLYCYRQHDRAAGTGNGDAAGGRQGAGGRR